MSKNVNVVNHKQMAQAEFKKFYGDDPAMYLPAAGSELSAYIEKTPRIFIPFLSPEKIRSSVNGLSRRNYYGSPLKL